MQQIEDALREEGALHNFDVKIGDANFNIDTQLSQIDASIVQKIDGAFLMVVNEMQAPAAVKKFNDAKIPVIGETFKLRDGSGNVIAPYVELDAEAVGAKCAQWVVTNWRSTGVDLSSWATVGVIKITNGRYQSDVNRVTSFAATLQKDLPNVQSSNIFMADVAAETTSTDETEAAYKSVGAVISTHPEISAWIMMSSTDHLAQGAARAVEAAGVEKKTILVSAGGELAVKEWANNAAPCWRATCYYSAKDFVEPMVQGMLAMCRQGKTEADIYPEFKDSGQKYGVVKISGNMCTPTTYKNFLK
jgi:L-arabinose transport system substrate-binding protein